MGESDLRVAIFTCNWNAHQSMQAAGRERLRFPAGARCLKVDCLGQISASVILKAFEKGADGVMLVGCSPEECHYEFGSRRAAQLFDEVVRLAKLLGFREDQLAFHQVHAEEGAVVVEKVQAFATQLRGDKHPRQGARETGRETKGDETSRHPEGGR